MSKFIAITEALNHQRAQNHVVKCIVNIGYAEGSDTRCDYVICVQQPKSLIVIKYNTACSVYDFNALMGGDYSKPLNAKKFRTTDEAYEKMMKWIGKMVKNDTRYRYYNNKVDHPYESVISDDVLDTLRKQLIEYNILKEVKS